MRDKCQLGVKFEWFVEPDKRYFPDLRSREPENPIQQSDLQIFGFQLAASLPDLVCFFLFTVHTGWRNDAWEDLCNLSHADCMQFACQCLGLVPTPCLTTNSLVAHRQWPVQPVNSPDASLAWCEAETSFAPLGQFGTGRDWRGRSWSDSASHSLGLANHLCCRSRWPVGKNPEPRPLCCSGQQPGRGRGRGGLRNHSLVRF